MPDFASWVCFCLQRILPPNYDYIVCEYKSLDSHGAEERFCAVVRVGQQDDDDDDGSIVRDAGISTAAEAEHWLQQFEMVSRTNWRVDKTYPDTHVKLVFKVTVLVLGIIQRCIYHCYCYLLHAMFNSTISYSAVELACLLIALKN